MSFDFDPALPAAQNIDRFYKHMESEPGCQSPFPHNRLSLQVGQVGQVGHLNKHWGFLSPRLGTIGGHGGQITRA